MSIYAYIHVGAVVSAYVTVFFLFFSAVGSYRHRKLGTAYAVSMLATSLSGFGIYSFTGGFSIFHALSIVTLVTILSAIRSIVIYKKTREKKYLIAHYFNFAYSFMGLNMAAIAQVMRLGDYSSLTQYFIIMGIAYIATYVFSDWIIQKVIFKRYAHIFGA